MGCSCSPLGRMISRAVKGRNGREGRARKEMFDYAMAYPPAQTCYVRPSARTITVTTNNHHQPVNAHAHTIPPEPMRTYAAVPGTATPPQAGAGNKPRKKKKKKKRVTFTPDAAGPMMMMPPNAPPPHAGHAPQHVAVAAASTGGGSIAAGSVYHHHGGAAEQPYAPAAPPPVHGGQGHSYGYGYGYGYNSRYTPSPLTRREVVGTPRRHEYFSSEYRWYYPTPVRESIYSFATDANHRLTNMFSEENPNACAIV
ncbi:hypothetical protein QOZ80_6AG0519520 [Eleusine coracana subsp. coracana]|nr:hypothetical protein QOZ80_6AG0519520 [Eleusine coracana subsp. coracana]